DQCSSHVFLRVAAVHLLVQLLMDLNAVLSRTNKKFHHLKITKNGAVIDDRQLHLLLDNDSSENKSLTLLESTHLHLGKGA
ncbi:hypothetical protein AVEN_46091-1, partial [Araneus ventricosus]